MYVCKTICTIHAQGKKNAELPCLPAHHAPLLIRNRPKKKLLSLEKRGDLNPFRAPEPLPILNPGNFVPQNGFPVVKGLRNSTAAVILNEVDSGYNLSKILRFPIGGPVRGFLLEDRCGFLSENLF